MIVNQQQNGWEIIYHRAHALLAAKLASQWRRRDQPEQLVETIAAIFNHDDLEREWDGDHVGPTGAPLDFTLDTNLDITKMERLIEGAFYRGRWVALLTSMHMSFLFEPSRGTVAKLDTYLDQQRDLQKRLRSELKIRKSVADQSYAFMQWCDRLSLILTRRELPERERALEISVGPDGQRYDIRERADGTLTVEPWPFEQDAFQVSVDAVYLEQVGFANRDELTQALQTATMQPLEWRFAKQGS